ncbi:MAG TPA: ATP-binding protein [Acidimicrobiales bacterium]|nr:ATP-binding protein [Acidimicrobiales bacterium]
MTETRSYPPEPASVTKARLFVLEALSSHTEDITDRAEVMVSELATNALRHTGTSFTVTVTVTVTHIRVEVSDAGAGRPEKRSPSALETSGRGLQIVEALSDHWEVVPAHPSGKTVLFELQLSAAAS